MFDAVLSRVGKATSVLTGSDVSVATAVDSAVPASTVPIPPKDPIVAVGAVLAVAVGSVGTDVALGSGEVVASWVTTPTTAAVGWIVGVGVPFRDRTKAAPPPTSSKSANPPINRGSRER